VGCLGSSGSEEGSGSEFIIEDWLFIFANLDEIDYS